MNSPLATLTPPPRATAPQVSDPVRRRCWLAGGVLVLLLAINLPAHLRTGLDCDPIVFDLYVRDAGRGKVLYRDMLENNTPAMIWLHAGVRAAFGWSSEALRAVDVMAVGTGVWLLAGWFNRGRVDRRLFAACVLGSVYLSATEWCHCQRDVWLLVPVLMALGMRRSAVMSTPHGPRAGGLPGSMSVTHPGKKTARGPCGVLSRAMLEGVIWGAAVWLKPHMVLVAGAVWLTGVALARGNGTPWRTIFRELAGLVAGGLMIGAAGVAAMMATGVFWPYVTHMTTWAGEYPGADMYGPYGRWMFRIAGVVRNLPWSGLYLVVMAVVLMKMARPLYGHRFAPSVDRALFGAAFITWAGQAWVLQHIFDYVHLPALLLAVTLLLHAEAERPWAMIAVGGLALASHAPLFADRLAALPDCFGPSTPALRDRLVRFDRIHWQHLQAVADYLAAENCRDGEMNVLSDTALPLYQLTGLTCPTRYYIPRNNMLSYKSHRAEIMAAFAAVPAQRFAVIDLAAQRWRPPDGWKWKQKDEWPVADCLGAWADRTAFHSGRYVVLRLEAREVPEFLYDVSEF